MATPGSSMVPLMSRSHKLAPLFGLVFRRSSISHPLLTGALGECLGAGCGGGGAGEGGAWLVLIGVIRQRCLVPVLGQPRRPKHLAACTALLPACLDL